MTTDIAPLHRLDRRPSKREAPITAVRILRAVRNHIRSGRYGSHSILEAFQEIADGLGAGEVLWESSSRCGCFSPRRLALAEADEFARKVPARPPGLWGGKTPFLTPTAARLRILDAAIEIVKVRERQERTAERVRRKMMGGEAA